MIGFNSLFQMPPSRRRVVRDPNPEASVGENPNLNPNPNPPPERVAESEALRGPPNDRRISSLFKAEHPPQYDGLGEPEAAEAWVRSMEKIFKYL